MFLTLKCGEEIDDTDNEDNEDDKKSKKNKDKTKDVNKDKINDEHDDKQEYLKCAICDSKTTTNFSYEDKVYFYIPVCSKHFKLIKEKENTIEALINNIKIVILT